jgi:16S rRNA (guanine966-N2)-methyltransferase
MLSGTPQPFDIVFLDPPFAADLWSAAAAGLERGWLAEDAWIYVESPVDAAIALPATWRLRREGRAGSARHALYRRVAADPLS